MTQEGTDAGPRGDQSDDSSSSYNDSFDNDDIPTDLSFRFAETRQRESATQTGRYTGPWGKGNFHYIENSKGQVPITKKCINEAKDRYGAIPTFATVTFKTFINTQGIKFVYEFEILYDADSQILPMQGFISKIEDSSHVIVMPYRPSEPSSVFSKEKIVVCPFTMTTLDSSQLTNQTMISFVTRISSKPSQGIQGLTLRGSITAAIGQRPPAQARTDSKIALCAQKFCHDSGPTHRRVPEVQLQFRHSRNATASTFSKRGSQWSTGCNRAGHKNSITFSLFHW